MMKRQALVFFVLVFCAGCAASAFNIGSLDRRQELTTQFEQISIQAKDTLERQQILNAFNRTGLFKGIGNSEPTLTISEYSYTKTVPAQGAECGTQIFNVLTLGLIPAACATTHSIQFCLQTARGNTCFHKVYLAQLVHGWLALPLLLSTDWTWSPRDETNLIADQVRGNYDAVRALFP